MSPEKQRFLSQAEVDAAFTVINTLEERWRLTILVRVLQLPGDYSRGSALVAISNGRPPQAGPTL